MLEVLFLMLAIGQCPGGRCPTPRVQPAAQRPQAMTARDMTAVNKVKAQIEADGYRVAPGVPVDPTHIASYDPKDSSIRLNSWSPYWEEKERNCEMLFKIGWHSTPHPDHTIRHEYGHAAFHRAVGMRGWIMANGSPPPLPAERVRRTVSGYAATSALDFQAEVYAGLKYGRTFPPDVLEAYAEMMRPK
jgi:hypothetical protein